MLDRLTAVDLTRTLARGDPPAPSGLTMDLTSSFGAGDRSASAGVWRGAAWFGGVIALVLLLGLQAGLPVSMALVSRFIASDAKYMSLRIFLEAPPGTWARVP